MIVLVAAVAGPACFSESDGLQTSAASSSETGSDETGSSSDALSSTDSGSETTATDGTTEDDGQDSSGGIDLPPVIEAFTVNDSATPPEVSTPGFVVLRVEASDDVGVARVELFDGDTPIGTIEAEPYTSDILVSARDNGSHAYRARVVDTAEQVTESEVVSLSIALPPGGTLEVDERVPGYRANDIACDREGHPVIVGWADPPAEDDDIWIAELPRDGGEPAWERTIAGPFDGGDRAFATALTPDGGWAVVGFDRQSANDVDVWLGVFGDEGQDGFTTGHAGTGGGTDRATAVAVDVDGRVLVAGLQTIFGTGERPFVGLFTAAGDPLSAPEVPSDVELFGATAVGDEFVVVGQQDPPDQPPRAWARRFLANGQVRWTRTYAADDADQSSSAVAVASALGQSIAIVGTTGTDDRGADVWVARIGPDGAELWSTTIDGGEAADEAAADVDVDVGGSIAIAATTAGLDAGTDLLVVRLDGAGEVDWTERLDQQDERVEATGVAVDPHGYVWAVADVFIDAIVADRLTVKLSP